MADFGFTAWAMPFILASVATGIIAFYNWKHRQTYPSAGSLACLMVNLLLWLMAYSLEILSTDEADMLRWQRNAIIAQGFIGPIWLLFSAHHTGLKNWLTAGRRVLVLLPAILTAILTVTNPWHHLLWRETILHTRPLSLVSPEPGPWFWTLAVYRYVYILIGTTLLYIPIVRSPALNKTQGLFVALGGLLPLAGNALHIFDLTHVLALDLGPFAFLGSGILLTLGLFTFRFIDILPLAQNVVFENMREGVIILDNKGNIVDLNPMACDMLDLSESALSSRSELERLLGRPLKSKLERALEKGQEFPLGPTGDMRWLKPAMYPLRNREGQIGGQILVLYDVTETHQLQEIRQDLVETMVHDLRNPLTIVRGSTELLIEDREGLPAEVIKLIEMIQASNTQCLELVNRISSLHRLENDQLYLDKRAVELFDVTNKIVQPLQTLADAKEQKLEVEVPPQLPPIYVDPGILQRILQNLLDNAIKFTPEGGTIRLAAQPHDGSIHVIVSDTGPGIPAELRPRLFQKFATGPTKQKGSGLGLAFCKLAVEAHGGQIWVESKAGQGSQFGFTLPVL